MAEIRRTSNRNAYSDAFAKGKGLDQWPRISLHELFVSYPGRLVCHSCDFGRDVARGGARIRGAPFRRPDREERWAPDAEPNQACRSVRDHYSSTAIDC